MTVVIHGENSSFPYIVSHFIDHFPGKLLSTTQSVLFSPIHKISRQLFPIHLSENQSLCLYPYPQPNINVYE